MKYTLEESMSLVGCPAYPERWQEIYADAMAEYDREGCVLADPAYYDDLHRKYGCMERHGELYRRAAAQVATDEPLARFLTLLSVALRDDAHRGEDIRKLALLKVPQGKEPLAYHMITGLALCSQLDRANEVLVRRGLPEEKRLWSLRTAVDCGVDTYMRQHNGDPGYNLLSWAQLHLQGRLARLGRLEIEFAATFRGRVSVFENTRGERVALANDIMLHQSGFALGSLYFEDETDAWHATIGEDALAWRGYPYREDGYVDREQITLDKAEWRQILTTGDPIISLHIPNHAHYGPLTPEGVDESLVAAMDYAAKYFPECPHKAFGCHSWLMDPQLKTMLGETSNIAKFLDRFEIITARSRGQAVFNFIFNRPDSNFDWHELPERTRLERGLKEHYLSGNAIYEMIGYMMI